MPAQQWEKTLRRQIKDNYGFGWNVIAQSGKTKLTRVQQHGYQSTNELAKTLKCNAEHLRLVCLDLFEQGLLQRHPRRTGKRGPPEYLYGVGDFSHVTLTPSLTTVPYISGEDDPAWGPRPEVI